MKIAIIGAGISGLVAAWHLRRQHSITVFEANDYVGGHSNTVEVSLDGTEYNIDTGFIVYNDWTYPNFIQLLNDLEVKSLPTEMSFSVHDPESGIEYNGHSLNTLFAQRRNFFRPRFHRMVLDIIRFNKQARQLADCGDDSGTTVQEFLENNRYSEAFRRLYLLPMGAAIWSCPPGDFAMFPIEFIAQFYRNHGLLNIRNRPQWRVIQNGSQTYVRRLIRDFEHRVRLSTGVCKVVREEACVRLHFDGGHIETFDHVVFACHADQALAILDTDARKNEFEILGAFPYSRNVAVLHTDSTVLPGNRRAWASWNFRLSNDEAAPASLTYNMNILQGIKSDHVFCVTLGGESKIDRAKILQRFVYRHPVFTTGRAAAQGRQRELLCSNRTSFCGAWWRNGFHEDGVVSALSVVEAIDQHVQRNPANTPVRETVK